MQSPLKVAFVALAVLLATSTCESGDTHLSGNPDASEADTSGDAVVEAEADADVGDCEPPCAAGYECVAGACVPVGADADADADAESDGDADADADAGPECLASCVNDPTGGPAGAPCEGSTDCETGYECFPEQIQVYDGELYAYWIDGYCASYGTGSSACDPYDPRTCPSGSECVYLGAGMGGDAYGCMDRCAVASREDVPWNDNCDCRDGYACELGSELCLSGCSNDRECCEIWDDRNGNGIRNTGEVTLLGPARCTDVCDPCSFSCTLEGCPGGDCAMGDPCEHDSDCPADSLCWIDESIAGGSCIRQRCDLVGRECPVGSGCADLGGGWNPYYACVTPCEPGTQPGDPGYPCRDTGPAGPSAGDFACMPTDSGGWYDATIASGYCWPGVFPGGDRPIGPTCASNDDCASPFGLGPCADWGEPNGCTVMCTEETAARGCADRSADTTLRAPATSRSASRPATTRWSAGRQRLPTRISRAQLPTDERLSLPGRRSLRPPGICYFPCASDAECVASYGPDTCDDASVPARPDGNAPTSSDHRRKPPSRSEPRPVGAARRGDLAAAATRSGSP